MSLSVADYHPYAWLLWLAAGMSAALITRNPLYLAILLLAAALVFITLDRRAAHPAAFARSGQWQPILRLALFLWAFTIIFNAFAVHLGDHVLFSLPRAWPLIGGIITLEAAVYGFVTGLSFVALIVVFAAFNSAVGPQTLLRLVPGFAHHAGVALTIALSFIPQTLVAWQDIRDAQRLRGYSVRRLRDFQPLFVSLLGIGLDRAIQLAESMDARGFGGNTAPLSARVRKKVGFGSVGGLVLLLVGLLLQAFLPAAWPAWLLMIAGALLLALVFRLQGQHLQRTRYRRWHWRPRDTIVAAISGLVIASLLALTMFNSPALFYYPYPPFPLAPHFNPALGLLFALLLAPALLLPPPIKQPSPASS